MVRKIIEKYRISIPGAYKTILNIFPNDYVIFDINKNNAIIKKYDKKVDSSTENIKKILANTYVTLPRKFVEMNNIKIGDYVNIEINFNEKAVILSKLNFEKDINQNDY